MRRHLEGIVAWAQTRQTNGLLEGLNGLFQAAKRKARGHAKASTIRMVVILLARNSTSRQPTRTLPSTHLKFNRTQEDDCDGKSRGFGLQTCFGLESPKITHSRSSFRPLVRSFPIGLFGCLRSSFAMPRRPFLHRPERHLRSAQDISIEDAAMFM